MVLPADSLRFRFNKYSGHRARNERVARSVIEALLGSYLDVKQALARQGIWCPETEERRAKFGGAWSDKAAASRRSLGTAERDPKYPKIHMQQ